jgi:hypothetical protein
MRKDLEDLVGRQIVLDTDGPLVYIGTLAHIGRRMLVFGEVDVHDMRDAQSTTTREVYIMQSRRHGIQANRDGVRVPLAKIASVSLLSDIKLF